MDPILALTPKFQQIVRKPTRGNKILSVIVTDLHQFYKDPEILPPINPDIIGKGKPSDHSTPFAEPITDWSGPRPKQDQGSKAPSRDHPNNSFMTRLDYIRVED